MTINNDDKKKSTSKKRPSNTEKLTTTSSKRSKAHSRAESPSTHVTEAQTGQQQNYKRFPSGSNMSKDKKARYPGFNLPIILSVFALLIAIIAVGESAIFWDKTIEKQGRIRAKFDSADQQLHQQQEAIVTLKATLADIQTQIQQQQQKLTEIEQAVHHAIAVAQANTEQWTLTEVSHLLRLANLSLQFNKNISGTIVLLEAANQRLGDMADPSFIPLRQAIADHILALKAVPQVDIVNVLTRLNALSNEVEKLPLVAKKSPQQSSTGSVSDDQKTKSRWRRMLSDSWQAIEKLVVIRHQSQPIEPLISPVQQGNLIKNIQLKLSEAQWAVLQHNQALYELSLTSAAQWVKQYFVNNDQATITVNKEIQTLRAIELNPKVPDMAKTQQMLKRLLTQYQNNLKATKKDTHS